MMYASHRKSRRAADWPRALWRFLRRPAGMRKADSMAVADWAPPAAQPETTTREHMRDWQDGSYTHKGESACNAVRLWCPRVPPYLRVTILPYSPDRSLTYA